MSYDNINKGYIMSLFCDMVSLLYYKSLLYGKYLCYMYEFVIIHRLAAMMQDVDGVFRFIDPLVHRYTITASLLTCRGCNRASICI